MPGLDERRNDPAYLLGRLLACLESAQIRAAKINGGVAPNVGIVDKYLAAAAASPGIVLSNLMPKSEPWLKKLDRIGAGWDARQGIGEVISLIDPATVPMRASRDERAMFILGYQQQRTANIRKASKAKPPTNGTVDSQPADAETSEPQSN